MGEYADAILDGTFCQTCGGYMGDDCGYPRSCRGGCSGESVGKLYMLPRSCKGYPKSKLAPVTANPQTSKVTCGYCGRQVAKQGLWDHIAALHRATVLRGPSEQLEEKK